MRRSSATHTARIYTQQLLFKLAFGDKADPPNYVGFQRGAVELHMQFQFEHEMETIRLRFLVEDPDALFSEYVNGALSAIPTTFTILRGGRANLPSTTSIAMHSPSTAICKCGEGGQMRSKPLIGKRSTWRA